MNSPALVRPPFSRPAHRRGLSLMELLIATTISIMVMGATVTLFGVVGERINGGRAMIEVADRLRSTQSLLSRDLRGHTARCLPWEQPSAGSGYFEILKEARDEKSRQHSRFGERHCSVIRKMFIIFTTRSPDQPFTGRYLIDGSQTTIESPLAEVVWYLQPTFNAQGQQVGANAADLHALSATILDFPVDRIPSHRRLRALQRRAQWFGFTKITIFPRIPTAKGNMVANSLGRFGVSRESICTQHFVSISNDFPINSRTGHAVETHDSNRAGAIRFLRTRKVPLRSMRTA